MSFSLSFVCLFDLFSLYSHQDEDKTQTEHKMNLEFTVKQLTERVGELEKQKTDLQESFHSRESEVSCFLIVDCSCACMMIDLHAQIAEKVSSLTKQKEDLEDSVSFLRSLLLFSLFFVIHSICTTYSCLIIKTRKNCCVPFCFMSWSIARRFCHSC